MRDPGPPDERNPEATRVVNSIEEHNGMVPKLIEPTIFGWLFWEIKKMARAVAIYSTGVITSEAEFSNARISQAIHGG